MTFNVRAPEAQRVELSGQFLDRNRPMEQDEAGLWSITVGPVEPSLDPYHFVADGIGAADPGSPELFPNEDFKASLVDIPGGTPAARVWEVPHGELTYGYYQSKTLNCTRPLLVYTPPRYREAPGSIRCSIFVSGTTDTEET